MTGRLVGAARNAVMLSFFLNGLCFATWVSRIPDARDGFALSNGELGLLLLAIAGGSVIALPATGALIERFGTVRVLRLGAGCAAVGLVVAAGGLGGQLSVTAVGLFVYGLGIGVWDVAMNVEGAEVERRLGRTIMPRFHAGFSLGTVAGALGGAVVVALGVPAAWHLAAVALGACGLVVVRSAAFLPTPTEPTTGPTTGPTTEPTAGRRSSARAWLEPRTLVIGVMVLALAMTEGTANDWLAVALMDGYGASQAVGVAGFGVFVAAMTATRFVGTGLIDRFGRVVVLRTTIATALAGVLLIVVGGHPAVAVVGIVLWGAGASLGFPVGMSAAADDPLHAAARVSVVSTIGYAAFLAGPPLLGFVGDRVGTLEALLVVALVLVPAALAVPAAAPLGGPGDRRRRAGRRYARRMVNLTRIYTRTGDDGTTRLGDMSTTSKSDARLAAYADVDEANAAIGVALATGGLEEGVAAVLTHVQNDLFDVGADLCTPVVAEPEFPPLRIEQDYVDRLEGWCDHYNEELPKLRSFILNGGTPAAAHLHVARTVVRRAERAGWAAWAEHEATMNVLALTYLNRLSDLIFILARHANREQGDVLWVPGGERG